MRPVDMMIESDASLTATSQGTRTGGPWSRQEACLHIPQKLLRAKSSLFSSENLSEERNEQTSTVAS